MNTTQHHSRGRQAGRAKHTGRWIALGTVIGIVLLAIATVSLISTAQSRQNVAVASTQSAGSPKGHFMDPNEVRSVKVAPQGEPMILDEGGASTAVVTLVEGKIPTNATQATVLTDENCAPDESGPTVGWSHCKNRIQFANGSQAVVQHHHKLSEVGCFTQGQTIKLV